MNGLESGFGWKKNWAETRQHFCDWWDRKGLVISTWGAWTKGRAPHAEAEWPPSVTENVLKGEGYANVERRAKCAYKQLADADYGLDILPLANIDIGPGSLVCALGGEPGFSRETVWFEPVWKDAANVKDLPPIRFNPGAPWWQVHEKQIRAINALANGNFRAALPDLVENIDILAALRGPQPCMMDMAENPEWVEACVWDINAASFEGFDRLHALAKGPDGGNGWGAFNVWGPGKTAKVQCDACSMFSPAMFDRFVAPALAAQCEWLDYSMYHLDGTHCVCHLDTLLKIDALDAIEWTPETGEPGWHERWHPLYKRILDAGKALQIIGVPPDKVDGILKVVGAQGVYIMTHFKDVEEIETLARVVDRWRK
jgi:hypothetical protein